MFPGSQQINDGGLAEKLKEASSRPMTKEERTEQRISFVYGQLGRKDKRTKKQVEKSLREQGLSSMEMVERLAPFVILLSALK